MTKREQRWQAEVVTGKRLDYRNTEAHDILSQTLLDRDLAT